MENWVWLEGREDLRLHTTYLVLVVGKQGLPEKDPQAWALANFYSNFRVKIWDNTAGAGRLLQWALRQK